MLLTDLFERNVKAFPHRPALTMRIGYRTTSLTYRQAYDLSLKVACWLQQQGVHREDRVLLLAPNSLYWVCVFWGCLFRGAIAVPLNLQSTGEMVAKIATQTEAKVLIKHLHFTESTPKGVPTYDIEFLTEQISSQDPSHLRRPSLSEEDLVEILYTSGTTGDPKGVMLSHRNLSSNVEALSKLIPVSSQDRFLSILPLSHVFEQVAGFLIPFSRGAQIVYASSPAVIRELMKEYRITMMVAVPEFLKIVMGRIETKAKEEGKEKLFIKMRRVSERIGLRPLQRLLFSPILARFGGRLDSVASGGAPLDPELERKWNALGVVVLQGYGLTETSPVVTVNTYRQRRVGSVGKVLPGVEVTLGPDGEVLVRGPNVTRGYFRNEEKTRESFTPDGRYKTGDIGEFDPDGFLFLKGRKKYMILGPGGQNVYPEDIETQLNRTPGVKDSCVLGLEDPEGVRIHAVLLFERPLDPGQVVLQANAHLASYQRITGWSVWPGEDFPRSATQKVKKEEVLRWALSRPEARPTFEEEKTPLMHLIAEITESDISRITSQTKIFQELNLDSLLLVELVSRIEKKFGVAIEESKMVLETTVGDLDRMIKEREPKKELPFKNWPLAPWASALRSILRPSFVIPLARLFAQIEVEGREQLKGISPPAIFMPNHISYLDSAILSLALPRPYQARTAFAAAIDVLYELYRPWAWLAELLFNSFPFPRREEENIKQGLEYIGRLLDRGWSVVVYPEGQMSPTGKMLPLKRGTGLVAVQMKVPIVPVKITGTERIVPYKKILPRRRGKVTIRFGAPLTFHPRDPYRLATETIQRALQEL